MYLSDKIKFVSVKLESNIEYTELETVTATTRTKDAIPSIVIYFSLVKDNKIWKKHSKQIIDDLVKVIDNIEDDVLENKIYIDTHDAIFTYFIDLFSSQHAVMCRKCFNLTPLWFHTGGIFYKEKTVTEFECAECGHKENYMYSRLLPGSNALIATEISKLAKLGYHTKTNHIPTFGKCDGEIVFTKRHRDIEDIIRNDSTFDLAYENPEGERVVTRIFTKEKPDYNYLSSDHILKFVADIKRLVEILEKYHKI